MLLPIYNMINIDFENIKGSFHEKWYYQAFVQNESVVQASDSAGSCEPSQTATNRQTDGSGTLLLQKSGKKDSLFSKAYTYIVPECRLFYNIFPFFFCRSLS